MYVLCKRIQIETGIEQSHFKVSINTSSIEGTEKVICQAEQFMQNILHLKEYLI